MTAMAARTLGYHVDALDPDPSCAARFVVENCITAQFDDDIAAAYLASRAQVVTIEIEKIGAKALEAVARIVPLRPSVEVLRTIQDRGLQKAWLTQNGFPIGPHRHAASAEELGASLKELGADSFIKTCTGGYDGRGQMQGSSANADKIWRALGPVDKVHCVVEKALSLQCEISVLVARRPSGEMAVYPPALNHHEQRILVWSVLPAPIPKRLIEQAQQIGRSIADKMKIEGLLVVEMFITTDGQLLVNELAPRPHNSFHSTEVGCTTSQFEQAVRAVCDLPLGATDLLKPAAIVNLLGDLWSKEGRAVTPAFAHALAIPGIRLHLYGKREARPGRKMGHLSATAASPEEAREKVLAAFAKL